MLRFSGAHDIADNCKHRTCCNGIGQAGALGVEGRQDMEGASLQRAHPTFVLDPLVTEWFGCGQFSVSSAQQAGSRDQNQGSFRQVLLCYNMLYG